MYEAAYAKMPIVNDNALNEMLNKPQFREAYARAQRIADLEGRKLPDIYRLQYDKNGQLLRDAEGELGLVGRHQETAGIASVGRVILGDEAREAPHLGEPAEIEAMIVAVRGPVDRGADGLGVVALASRRRAQDIAVVIGAELQARQNQIGRAHV